MADELVVASTHNSVNFASAPCSKAACTSILCSSANVQSLCVEVSAAYCDRAHKGVVCGAGFVSGYARVSDFERGSPSLTSLGAAGRQ